MRRLIGATSHRQVALVATMESGGRGDMTMRALVTGAGGFIGSHVVDRLLGGGNDVVGIDCFTEYYPSDTKRRNLSQAMKSAHFELVELDLVTGDLDQFLEGADVVFHLAGQPGVRNSWAEGFDDYLRENVLATQRLLEAATRHPIERFVYSSSSSVYGNAARFPTAETDLPAPMSPYGVTKLAAEHMCGLYHMNHGVPIVALRYFTVFGPRQRPDMAMQRLIESAITGSEFTLFGDGSQIRDFTYVDDVVAANLAAAIADSAIGSIINIGGGSAATMIEVIEAVEDAVGTAPNVVRTGEVAGDVTRTGADISLAARQLGWTPSVTVRDGIARQAKDRLASVDEVE